MPNMIFNSPLVYVEKDFLQMIQCSCCRSMVDERVNRSCPQCSAPLVSQSAPAQTPGAVPNAAAPGNPVGNRPNVRVSLTGEVMEDAPVPGTPANSPYANSQVGRPPMPSTPPRAVPSSYARRETEPDNSGKKALLINLSVVLVLLALCGGGGYWKWMHRTNPKAQVTRYIHAIQWLDWGVTWDLSATPPGGKHRREFIDMMNDKFDNNGVLNIAARHGMEKIPFEIGEPTIEGNEATVPVTRGETRSDPAKSMQFKLTNFGGVWKIHPLAANPLDLMHDPNAAKIFDDKIPSLTPGAGGLPVFH